MNLKRQSNSDASFFTHLVVRREDMKIIIYTITVLFSLIYSSAFAQSFTSDKTRVNLIELYTSEGCSSCPPADDWLGKLQHDPRLWSEFIPIAFHVDYWDYIGWKDPFAKPQFSSRQRQYSQQNNLSSVYTPGMLLNGQEWTSWRRQSNLEYGPAKSAGKLTVNLDDDSVSASYQPLRKSNSSIVLNIAILGFNLKVDVKTGENSGRILIHDFVVIGYQKIAMDLSSEGLYTVSAANLPNPSVKSSTKALVTWINDKNNLSPIQVTGGWIN
ncbi:MAG: DUF1223 domain-containing protein [Gammaproteobacteria bacterium]|nr:MAG: DUF1223 domain-containing protein [Gammaproteobacteria bacterium]